MMFIGNDKMIGLPYSSYLILENTAMMVRYPVINLLLHFFMYSSQKPMCSQGYYKNHSPNTELIDFLLFDFFLFLNPNMVMTNL